MAAPGSAVPVDAEEPGSGRRGDAAAGGKAVAPVAASGLAQSGGGRRSTSAPDLVKPSFEAQPPLPPPRLLPPSHHGSPPSGAPPGAQPLWPRRRCRSFPTPRPARPGAASSGAPPALRNLPGPRGCEHPAAAPRIAAETARGRTARGPVDGPPVGDPMRRRRQRPGRGASPHTRRPRASAPEPPVCDGGGGRRLPARAPSDGPPAAPGPRSPCGARGPGPAAPRRGRRRRRRELRGPGRSTRWVGAGCAREAAGGGSLHRSSWVPPANPNHTNARPRVGPPWMDGRPRGRPPGAGSGAAGASAAAGPAEGGERAGPARRRARRWG